MPAASAQRVLDSVSHRQPDRVPIDFGATFVSGIHVSCVAGLRKHYGLADTPVKLADPGQMLGVIDDDLRDAMGIDTVGVYAPRNRYGIANADWRECRMPWGQVVLAPGAFKTTPAPDGGIYMHPGGDTSLPPSAHLPATGYFFDSIERQQPIDEDNLNPDDNLQEYGDITDADLGYFARETAAARATGRAVVASFGGTAIGDVGQLPVPGIDNPRGFRSAAEWYMAVIQYPDYVHTMFERQYDIALRNLARLHEATGDNVDVVYLCGADFGTQTSQFFSVNTFREIYLPHYRRLNDWIHANTKWKTFKHSCGAIDPLIPSLIEAGFDILNPVQCSATGMEPEHLKNTYGRDITFWGGGVNTQATLPHGSPAEVRDEVLRRCEIFAPGGGFVFNSIHNTQALTPVENIVAMIDAVREYNGR